MSTTRFRVTDIFTRDEIRDLTAKSDLAGWWAVLSTWGIIAGTFAVMALWPNPATILLGLIVLGGRQLALSILMHEAAHYSLFKTRALNNVVGDWFCARLVWNDVARYRQHHVQHHSHTNSELDPDLSLVAPFPTSRASLRRKFVRDLTGATGLKRLLGLALMDIGALTYTVSGGARRRPRDGRRWTDYAREGIRNMAGVVIANLVLAGLLAASGHAWLYLVWFAAYMTTYSLFVRIRALAEHACTEYSDHPLRNTRTTRAGFLARLTVAPIHVNYHLEHHLLPSVPYHHLPRMHALVKARTGMDDAPDYLDVLRLVSAKPATA
ncbi:fatty acid desaturase family protein [Zavarzinia sp.]|uniref:fatty acid desaturase family protein n=1 Tax=Zavarzinia sp. TaxID=2027920 RepID=UPI00356A8A74